MNRNQRRRLDRDRYVAQQSDFEDRMIASIALGLRREYKFSGEKIGKAIRGMRLVICDGANRRHLSAPQLIRFCCMETGMDKSEITIGRDVMEDINLAAAMLALYSNFGFREKRIKKAMLAIKTVMVECQGMTGKEMMDLLVKEAKIKVC